MKQPVKQSVKQSVTQLTRQSAVPTVNGVTPTAHLEQRLERLTRNKGIWAQLGLESRRALLQDCLQATVAVAPDWVAAGCAAKGIDPDSALAGEEWLTGPMAFCRHLRLLDQALAQQGQPLPPKLLTRPDGQQVAEVFPATAIDRIVWPGIRAQVWIEPGQPSTQGHFYRQQAQGLETKGSLVLVLGAGNVSSIGPSDALHHLYVEGSVVLLKLNPVNSYLGPIFEQALKPLREAGFLALAQGGAETGSYLCQHPLVDAIHITGSHHTHDAIVWGSPSQQQQRKASGDPVLTKPITSELGCVTPVLVVPGPWSAADLTYQARQMASMVANNASFNCNAAKLVVTAKGWPQRQAFLDALRRELAQMPPRLAYYPGAQHRYQGFLDHYPQAEILGAAGEQIVPWTLIPDLDPRQDPYALQTEAFCGILAETALEVADPADFLTEAVPFVNEQVWGTLSCMIMIDPATAKTVSSELDQAISRLRYGSIAINGWSALLYGLMVTTWGAFPGHSLADIQSGRGVVHNCYLFDHPQKSVAWVPFRMPTTPPWFVGHRNLHRLAQRLTWMEADPSWLKVPGVIAAALRS